MLVRACRQDTKINKWRFWRLSTATIAITSYPASDNSHNGSRVTRTWNTLSPKNIIGRHLTTQNRVKPSKKPKKDKGYYNNEGNRQQRITGKAILPESSKACTTRAFIYWLKQVQQSRSASLARLHPTIDMSLDNNLDWQNWKQFKGRLLTSLGRPYLSQP
jgi:hypothetical protein